MRDPTWKNSLFSQWLVGVDMGELRSCLRLSCSLTFLGPMLDEGFCLEAGEARVCSGSRVWASRFWERASC